MGGLLPQGHTDHDGRRALLCIFSDAGVLAMLGVSDANYYICLGHGGAYGIALCALFVNFDWSWSSDPTEITAAAP